MRVRPLFAFTGISIGYWVRLWLLGLPLWAVTLIEPAGVQVEVTLGVFHDIEHDKRIRSRPLYHRPAHNWWKRDGSGRRVNWRSATREVRSKKPKLQSKEFYFQPFRCMISQQFSPTVLWNLVLEVAECPVSLRQFRDNSQST